MNLPNRVRPSFSGRNVPIWDETATENKRKGARRSFQSEKYEINILENQSKTSRSMWGTLLGKVRHSICARRKWVGFPYAQTQGKFIERNSKPEARSNDTEDSGKRSHSHHPLILTWARSGFKCRKGARA